MLAAATFVPLPSMDPDLAMIEDILRGPELQSVVDSMTSSGSSEASLRPSMSRESPPQPGSYFNLDCQSQANVPCYSPNMTAPATSASAYPRPGDSQYPAAASSNGSMTSPGAGVISTSTYMSLNSSGQGGSPSIQMKAASVDVGGSNPGSSSGHLSTFQPQVRSPNAINQHSPMLDCQSSGGTMEARQANAASCSSTTTNSAMFPGGGGSSGQQGSPVSGSPTCLSPQDNHPMNPQHNPLHSPLPHRYDQEQNQELAPEMNFGSGMPGHVGGLQGGSSSSPLAAEGMQGLGHASQETVSSTMEERDRKRTRNTGIAQMKLEGRRCQVCDDAASGFHYGVWSCEGCKAFFKRSLQGPVDYVCPATNNCTIDRHRRKSCQACRLQKCYKMGMSRGNCRREKTLSKAPGQANPRKSKSSDYMDDPSGKTPRIKVDPDGPMDHGLHYDYGLGPDTGFNPASAANPSGTPGQPLPVHPLVEHLMSIDPPVRHANHDSSLPDNEVNLMTSLLRLADIELVDIITWAKTVPGYGELDLQVRIHMLEACWMEVLILGLLWRSLGYKDVLVFAPDLHFDKKRVSVSQMESISQPILKLVLSMQNMKVTREEIILLRICILLNADLCEDDEDAQPKINSILSRVEAAWQYTVIERGGKTSLRITRLLMLLPHIRHSALNCVAYIFNLKEQESIPIRPLLEEMMEGRHIVSSSRGSTSHPNSDQSQTAPTDAAATLPTKPSPAPHNG